MIVEKIEELEVEVVEELEETEQGEGGFGSTGTSLLRPLMTNPQQLDIFALIRSSQSESPLDVHVLIDSGCTKSCIDKGFVRRYDLPTEKLNHPYAIYNVDGTSNEGGRIEDIAVIELQIGDHSEEIRLPVMTIASSNIFLGYDWLAKHNPEIDWKKGEIEFTRCPTGCLDLGPDAEEVRGMTDGDLEKEIPPTWRNTHTSSASKTSKGYLSIDPGITRLNSYWGFSPVIARLTL